MNWLKNSSMSFVAAFGWLNIFMPDVYYQVYYGSIILAFAIAFVYFGKKNISRKMKAVVSNGSGFWRFSIYMFANMLLSFAIALYYSYFNDFQPHGRYFILAIFSIMFFAAKCLESNGAEEFPNMKRANIRKGIQVLYPIFLLLYLNMFLFQELSDIIFKKMHARRE